MKRKNKYDLVQEIAVLNNKRLAAIQLLSDVLDAYTFEGYDDKWRADTAIQRIKCALDRLK